MDIDNLPEDMKLFPLKKVAEILGVTVRTVHRYIDTGQLEANKMGGQWRVSQPAIREFMKGNKNNNE